MSFARKIAVAIAAVILLPGLIVSIPAYTESKDPDVADIMAEMTGVLKLTEEQVPAVEKALTGYLANLDKVPDAGAIVVVTFPKPKGGSGFPARVFAILP